MNLCTTDKTLNLSATKNLLHTVRNAKTNSISLKEQSIEWLEPVGAHINQDVYLLEDVLFQLPGYMLLIAMTLTSFKYWRNKITAQQWKLLHRFGIYFLWFTVWYTYWYELYVYQDIQIIDHVYYWSGLLVLGLRIVAWNKQRWFNTRVTA